MNIIEDMLRLTPAPTVQREVAVFFLTVAVLVIVAFLATSSANGTLVLVLVGVLAVYAAGRLVYRLLNPAKVTTQR
ncbi:hypothetical protein HW450_09060 [Corynebacterium hindlerae]|uniref:Uncharacterized protein n=1 Tax=Corynebacterium hindlerae TaxID=699041 RepID=A0A7G5FD19_9CORY|nr:hypothetical protein [Corynebacterium hindlerae]QMV84510.1 hypothetical protein HW450_09060 [Corynebacterium hindlerae]